MSKPINVYKPYRGVSLAEQSDRASYIPKFRSSKEYADLKIGMLKDDFYLRLTEKDEAYIRRFKTEHEIDSACRAMLNKYWK